MGRILGGLREAITDRSSLKDEKFMKRQRDSLVSIKEVFSELDDGPVKAIREATPQAVHHFTQADQVNQLVEASEADPIWASWRR